MYPTSNMSPCRSIRHGVPEGGHPRHLGPEYMLGRPWDITFPYRVEEDRIQRIFFRGV